MGGPLKFAMACLFLVLGMETSKTAELKWLMPITFDARVQTPIVDIRKTDFVEIAVSKFDGAENSLRSVAFKIVGNQQIDHFGQRNFRCSSDKQAYLVRALYSNGATGEYYVRRYGTALLIEHGSLGSASDDKRSALVVRLDFEPTAVYGQTGGAL